MRGARAACLVLALGACAAAADPVVPPRLAPLFDARGDEVVARVFVPSPEQKVGEVRLVRRGDFDVVQTLLYTKVLSRVVAEIRKKELANWPEGKAGHADALRYADALENARREIWSRVPSDVRLADRRQKLWIEFVLGARAGAIALGTFEIEEGPGAVVHPTSRETLALLEPTRDYLRRNMRLIAADSFVVEQGALTTLLAPMRWIREER